MHLARKTLAEVGFVLLLVFALTDQTGATTLVLNFDSVSVPAFGTADATSYLAGFGISLSDVTPGGGIVIRNDSDPSNFIVPPSLPNTLSYASFVGQIPNTFTLNFATPLDSVAFTRPELIAGSSGVTHPEWSAHAFNSLDTEVAAVGQGLIAAFSNVPAQTFTLSAPDIRKVRIDSNNFAFASTVGVVIDDLVLTSVPEPGTLLLLGSGFTAIGALALRRNRGKSV